MSAKLVALPTIAGLAQSAVVELLELALARAQNGELQNVAIVGTLQNDYDYAAFSGNINRLRLVGQLELVKANLLDEVRNDEERMEDDED